MSGRFADIDAVTIDAFGTLLELDDAAGIERLRLLSAGAFLGELGLELAPVEFAPAFALPFRPIAGAGDAVAALAGRGLSLAVVANWDVSLHGQLEAHGLDHWFQTVVVSAEVGAEKPDPEPFRVALERLGVDVARTVHVGDSDEHDRAGAAAAGLRFLPAPLATAFAGWS